MTYALRIAVSMLLVAGLLGGCGSSGTSVEPPGGLGPFAVGHTSFTAMDAAREDRSLPLDVWYPVDAGQDQDSPRTEYPLAAGIGLESEVAFEDPPVSSREGQTLLVFSHGYQGINTQSTALMEVLASHGFIVVSPEHTGNAQFSNDDSFEEAAANRVPDVSFVIDTMIAKNNDSADAFFGRLDEGRVGVVGHSFGGMTAVGVVAGWAGANPDPRVAAVVPISAVIDAELQSDDRPSPNAGFTAEQLSGVQVPVMLMGGTLDVNVLIENNQIAFDQLTNVPAVYKVDVVGATHTHFANVCTFGDLLFDIGFNQDGWPSLGAEALIAPYEESCTEDAVPIEDVARVRNVFVVSFFRRHLLNDEDYGAFLTDGYAATEPLVTFAVK